MKKKTDKKAPYKGLTPKQFMKKKHPDITVISTPDNGEVLFGVFCGFAEGPVTDIACQTLCERYSSCDEACHNGDLSKILEREGGTWCDVCGDTIPESSDAVRVSHQGRRYKVCSEGCADVIRSTEV